MKKTNLIKVLLVMIVSIMVVLFSSNVLAATDADGYEDLTEALGNSSSNSGNTNNNSANTNTNNANTSTDVPGNETQLLANNNNTANTNSNRTNNSSIYNNTSLPKTGLADSVPVVLLVVVFGVSAIYAYKKINDYKNI